jgi:hypothetical protein
METTGQIPSPRPDTTNRRGKTFKDQAKQGDAFCDKQAKEKML